MAEKTIVSQIIKFSIEELQALVLQQPKYFPIFFVGETPIHLYTGPEIPGEIFRQGFVQVGTDKVEIQASNMGRIKSLSNEILLPKEDPPGKDYLFTEINSEFRKVYVHRIVASLWLDHPDITSGLEVHHISNNGYDNRPCNLLWIGAEHSQIKHKRFS